MRVLIDPGNCFPTGKHYPGIAHLLRVVAAGLADEYSGEHAVSEMQLVAIDTETTGRDPEVDRIVEIACVVWKNRQVILRQSWLVNPGRSVDKEAFEVHGIGDDELADKPGFGSIADQVLIALSGSVPVAYNAEFDREFLFAELRRANKSIGHLPPAARKAVEWIDPLVWARELHRIEKSKALGDVCARLGIDLGQAHRAIHDAEATLQVFSAFLTDTRVPKTYAALIQEQRRLARQFDEEKVRWRARPG